MKAPLLKRICRRLKRMLLGSDYLFFKKAVRTSAGEKIYPPYYNLFCDIQDQVPEIYNKFGKSMEVFFIRDFHIAHAPYHNSSDYFLWDRFNIGLKTHFYTHAAMLETMGKPTYRYGALIESPAIVPKDYEIFSKHKGVERDFDAIFTYDEKILNSIENAKFFPWCAGLWYGNPLGGGELDGAAYQRKTENISIVSSNKRSCELHIARIKLAEKLQKEGLAKAFGTFNSSKTIKISESLEKFRYSVVIENMITPYFFTEKITNCFAAMTVPIYLGATKIHEFFNVDGIIQIGLQDVDNIEKIIAQCGAYDYEQRLPAIKDNYEKALCFKNINNYLYESFFLK